MVDTRTLALAFIKREGPILPAQLANEIKTNILLASAILSELSSKNHVFITSVKRGGSPFYYTKGQESKLSNLSIYLPEKPKEAFELLKLEKIIRDKSLEPWQRVALKEIKDFAIPLNVGFGGKYEIFWKWYLTTNDEAKDLIKEIVNLNKKKVKKEEPIKKDKSISEFIKKESEIVKKEKVVQSLEGIPETISSFFNSKEIYVISQEMVRKNKEFNFTIDVPSNLGSLRFFVKYKSKKSITDSDLISSLAQAKDKKLPLLFLTEGTLSRKAEKYLNENKSGGLVFKTI
jgi:hypothetical protein